VSTPLGQRVHEHALSSLFRRGSARSRRASSYDRTGRNADFLQVGAGETAELLRVDGAGCVTRLYCAMILPDLADHRNAILRCYWDGREAPSVEVPLGDFFALAHGRVRDLSSALVAVAPGFGSSYGLTTYLPMPFSDGARITVENRGEKTLGGVLGALWYHVDYEVYETPLPEDVLRLHAVFRTERRTVPMGERPNVQLHDGVNLTGEDNFVALNTVGSGRMVGLVLQVQNPNGPVWYGEGDDMVFVDGEPWPPSIHGTGTEEIFGGGACPSTEYASLYSGFHLIESPAFDGLVGMYRWYVPDPIHFTTSLRWTIEHGHANNFASGYTSVAYWYQEPAAALPELEASADIALELGDDYERAHSAVTAAAAVALETEDPEEASRRFDELCRVADPLYRGDFERARANVASLEWVDG
jgi:hypothetical protein